MVSIFSHMPPTERFRFSKEVAAMARRREKTGCRSGSCWIAGPKSPGQLIRDHIEVAPGRIVLGARSSLSPRICSNTALLDEISRRHDYVADGTIPQVVTQQGSARCRVRTAGTIRSGGFNLMGNGVFRPCGMRKSSASGSRVKSTL